MRLGELADPQVADDRVLVRVTAAGVNPADHKLRSGTAGQMPHRFPIVAGMDIAGRVAAVGPGVHSFDPGQRVFGYIGLPFMVDGGSWADLSAVDARSLAAIPAGLSDEIAAALPCAGLTALLMADTLHVHHGDRVLVHAAAGGVGHLFSQMAVLRGAEVVGTASTRNLDYLRSLGAEPVDYRNGLDDLGRLAPTGFDAVADFYGGDAISKTMPFVRRDARLASVAPPPGSEVARIAVRPTAEGASQLAALVTNASLRVRIADVVPFDAAHDALSTVERGAALDKFVLRGLES
jgi:NADPH:quinone reductase-like Zn-dependent oxidoreductase